MRCAFAVLGLVLISCAAETQDAGDVLVTGRLVDHETGQPVSRATIYVHAFCDDVGRRVTLEPAEGSTFSFRLPTRHVRLRVADVGDEYALWERTFSIEGDTLDHEVHLRPLHWIRLHGRILVEEDGRLKPLPPGDGGVGSRAMVSFHPGGRMHENESEATYWIRVPRERIRVRCVDSAQMPETKEIDFTGATEAEHEFDVILR